LAAGGLASCRALKNLWHMHDILGLPIKNAGWMVQPADAKVKT